MSKSGCQLLEFGSKAPSINKLMGYLADGDSVGVTGVFGSAIAYLTALIRKRLRRHIVVVANGPAEIERIVSDITTVSGASVYSFPEWETLPGEEVEPHPDIIGERFLVLLKLLEGEGALEKPAPGRGEPLIIVASFRSLSQKILKPKAFVSATLTVKRGQDLAVDGLVQYLEGGGYRRVDMVEEKGEYCVRGGIVDLFPPMRDYPLRLEFFGDEVETIRKFHTQNQRTISELKDVSITPASESKLINTHKKKLGSLLDYLSEDTIFAVHEPAEGLQEFKESELHREFFIPPNDVASMLEARQTIFLSLLPDDSVRHLVKRSLALNFQTTEPYRSLSFEGELGADLERRIFTHLGNWMREGMNLVVFCNNVGEKKRLLELLKERGVRLAAGSGIFIGRLSEGFIFSEGRVVLLTDQEIFGRYKLRRRRVRFKGTTGVREFSELRPGDFVVHVRHGIGLYRGIKKLHKEGVQRDFLCIEYQDKAKLYVPLDQANLLERYVGLSKTAPHLDRLGGKRWQTVRVAAQRAIFDFAAELLELQAMRKSKQGYTYPSDTDWQREFEQAFIYDETPDQAAAIEDVKRDMESPHPMERLICGDVGYGKTEVAMRAAFKTVMAGKQVAVLVPTTILAQQHLQTFSDRFADYPVCIEMLSRFRTERQQGLVVEGLKKGTVDIVIGTHRLIQPDLSFKDLGLVIIDEEQRFGVRHKEQLKRLRMTVDVLSLTATPIPRTLYMSMAGIRDMSTINTPPEDRLSIETVVCEYDGSVIRDAIRREIGRQGQVYFVHNRVETIDRVKEKLERLVPEATFAVGHGQMADVELEEVMRSFVEGKIDVLVCTTIIESGLDIPNVNTIIIDRADRFGLAGLYQLRGRVGRYRHRAYAYCLYPKGMALFDDARRRLKAIMDHTSLGSGFKIALRDLEIRGAGNILGAEQHGHIAAIGFDLYCKLLRRTIASLKGKEVKGVEQIEIQLPFVSELPRSYIPADSQRIDLYKRLGDITSYEDIEEIADELRDRFGPLPEQARLLLEVFRIKLSARDRSMTSVQIYDDKIIAVRNGDEIRPGGRYPRMTKRKPLEIAGEIRERIESL